MQRLTKEQLGFSTVPIDGLVLLGWEVPLPIRHIIQMIKASGYDVEVFKQNGSDTFVVFRTGHHWVQEPVGMKKVPFDLPVWKGEV